LPLLALLGAWAAGIALLRRTTGGRRERVDLYFEDGSMQSLSNGAPEAARLLPLARAALAAARGG
jgi:hypothetical protein